MRHPRTRAPRVRLLVASVAAITALAATERAAPRDPPPSAGDPHGPQTSWSTNGANLFNQRHSSLTQINRDNVKTVKAVWRASLRGSGLDRRNSGQAQAVVSDGVLYTITGNDDVFAISIDTGEVLWEYQANLDAANVAVCCGWVSRGVGIG